MARFKGKDLYLSHDDQIYFGDNQEGALWYLDNELRLDHTISGTKATQGYHLARFDQVPDEFTDFTDTPATYSGYGGYNVSVKDDETGLEFTSPTASGVEYRDFTAGSFMLPPANIRPGYRYAGPVAGLAFDDNSDECVFGALRIPENIKNGQDVILTVYALNDDAQTAIKACKWCIDYHTYDNGDNYTSKTTTTVCMSTNLQNNAPAGDRFETDITISFNDANNPLSKETLEFRLYRDANDAADTLSGDAVMTLSSFRFLTEAN